jgi:NAD(P)-dependent dehydrogenase (short-subunit alcohol dehydrogenase family)
VTDNRVLAGKVAIVTGARRGIGAAEARALAAAGSTVVICDHVYEELLTVKAGIEDAGGTCMAVKCDVSDKAQVVHVVDETTSTYGRVDVLINNAQGAMEPTPWADISDDMVITSLMTGPVASYWFMQACFPHMKTQGRGRIINTASAAARGGIANLGHYAMAKGAIASLTYAAATDWGEFGITANVIFPGIESESLTQYLSDKPELRAHYEAGIPLKRFGNPSTDLAPVVVFIASDASQYLTGHPFFIDGGVAHAPR